MKTTEIRIRDPFVLADNGKYYMIGSQGYNGLKFVVYISNDLENWSEPVTVFENNDSFWATMNFWAPEMHKYNGRYYIFASFKSEERHRGTQILVSDKPDGKFVPLSEYPVTPSDWECLDGTLYIDKKGNPHMVFCHEWTQVRNGEICSIQLSDDLTKAVTEPELLFKAADFACVKSIDKDDGFVTDGPFLHRDGEDLYMIWSSFAENGYFTGAVKSDNGEIDGNWIFQDELIYDADGGHGMIFKAFDGKLKLVLHTPNSETEHAEIFDLCVENGKMKIK